MFATSLVYYTDALLSYRVDALFFKVFVLGTGYAATLALNLYTNYAVEVVPLLDY